MAEIAAPPAERDTGALAESRRPRVSGWTAAVAASALLLAAALTTLAGLWISSATTTSTSYTAKLPGTLLGVEVVVAHGDVEIVGGGAVDVLVERRESATFGHAPAERRSIQDGVLRIESSCRALVVGSCEADYRISIPDNVKATVGAAHGDVRVNAFRGSADLSTRGGSILVEAFCGLVLHAAARGGDVEVQASCSPERVETRTDTGDVLIAVPRGTYSIEADSNAGRVDVDGLAQLDTAPFRIQALSNSGDVVVRAGS